MDQRRPAQAHWTHRTWPTCCCCLGRHKVRLGMLSMMHSSLHPGVSVGATHGPLNVTACCLEHLTAGQHMTVNSHSSLGDLSATLGCPGKQCSSPAAGWLTHKSRRDWLATT